MSKRSALMAATVKDDGGCYRGHFHDGAAERRDEHEEWWSSFSR